MPFQKLFTQKDFKSPLRNKRTIENLKYKHNSVLLSKLCCILFKVSCSKKIDKYSYLVSESSSFQCPKAKRNRNIIKRFRRWSLNET